MTDLRKKDEVVKAVKEIFLKIYSDRVLGAITHAHHNLIRILQNHGNYIVKDGNPIPEEIR